MVVLICRSTVSAEYGFSVPRPKVPLCWILFKVLFGTGWRQARLAKFMLDYLKPT